MQPCWPANGQPGPGPVKAIGPTSPPTGLLRDAEIFTIESRWTDALHYRMSKTAAATRWRPRGALRRSSRRVWPHGAPSNGFTAAPLGCLARAQRILKCRRRARASGQRIEAAAGKISRPLPRLCLDLKFFSCI
jgi:hypothetical protein